VLQEAIAQAGGARGRRENPDHGEPWLLLHTGSARHQKEAKSQGDEEPKGTARHGGLLRSWMCGDILPVSTREGNRILQNKSSQSVE
jgi:hypothetical protein